MAANNKKLKQVFITLDYEVFFGENTGSVENCIIKPTNELLKIVNQYNAKMVFFVDVGFLLALKRQMAEVESLKRNYETITAQLRTLCNDGHDIQLHIHTHWEDSFYDITNKKWVINVDRYKLSDFSAGEIDEIVGRYKQELELISGKPVFAFRAGGWCIQPFEKIRAAFKKHNIWLDSTVFKNGYSESIAHFYNFKGSPDKTFWKFESDPIVEQNNGFFTEIPIAAHKVTPWFFVKFAFRKKLRNNNLNKAFGDGKAIMQNSSSIIKKFTKSSYSVVSIDGYKASYLSKAFDKFKRNERNEHFVVIGHPKALSLYSLQKLTEFLKRNKNEIAIKTFSDFV